jgi:hypothetical protein
MLPLALVVYDGAGLRVSTDEQSLEVVFVAVGTGLCPLKVFNQKDILLFGRCTSQKARLSDTGLFRPFKHLLGPILTFVEDSCHFSGKFTTYMRNSFSSDTFRPMRGPSSGSARILKSACI